LIPVFVATISFILVIFGFASCRSVTLKSSLFIKEKNMGIWYFEALGNEKKLQCHPYSHSRGIGPLWIAARVTMSLVVGIGLLIIGFLFRTIVSPLSLTGWRCLLISCFLCCIFNGLFIFFFVFSDACLNNSLIHDHRAICLLSEGAYASISANACWLTTLFTMWLYTPFVRDRKKKSNAFDLNQNKPKERKLHRKDVGKKKEGRNDMSLVRDDRIFNQLNISESSASFLDAIQGIEMKSLREIQKKIVDDVEMAKSGDRAKESKDQLQIEKDRYVKSQDSRLSKAKSESQIESQTDIPYGMLQYESLKHCLSEESSNSKNAARLNARLKRNKIDMNKDSLGILEGKKVVEDVETTKSGDRAKEQSQNHPLSLMKEYESLKDLLPEEDDNSRFTRIIRKQISSDLGSDSDDQSSMGVLETIFSAHNLALLCNDSENELDSNE